MWLWLLSNIAGSLLGAASTKYLKDTKLGIWGYKQFELICGWAAKRYGVDLLDKEGIAWKRKYPKVAAKIDDLESRITKLEKRRKKMKAIENVGKWIIGLTHISVMFLTLAIVWQMLFGSVVPFIGGDVVGNIIGIITQLGNSGLVGLIAVAVIFWLFRHQKDFD